MKKHCFYASLVFALLGAETPKWFSNPSLNSQSLYGFGIGEDIKEAKDNALLDLATSIRSSVNVVLEREIQRNDANLTSKASQKSRVSSEVLDLMNVEPTKVECQEDQCYVQVEISKADLIDQLKRRIEQRSKEIASNNSPFEYQYREKLLSKIHKDYVLYLSLGGNVMQIPQAEDKPIFDLVFVYNGDLSKSFKSILEKTIQDYLTKFGKLSSKSDWKIIVEVFKEGNDFTLDISTKYGDEVLHNASVSDRQKPSVSSSFFAKRLGVQTYKKMQKWGKN